ncbi:hypothetical protein [Pedobacter borealis]|uniref:hypothetical protein n=1 Tax=Pedobacter borealis TaxID=475254 RepID=UPI0012FBB26C|nr:hypothetical protein [Pedobacter borealis]
MFTGDTSAKQISFSAKGLNLLHMGSKASTDIESDLIDIDTSTTEGFMEYLSIMDSPAHEGYEYKKLISKDYVFKGMEKVPFDLLLAISPKDGVKAIKINFKTSNHQSIKDILTNVYGKHNTEVSTEYSTEINDVSYQSLYWSYSDFEIRFSGSEVNIFYPLPKEHIEKLLRQPID